MLITRLATKVSETLTNARLIADREKKGYLTSPTNLILSRKKESTKAMSEIVLLENIVAKKLVEPSLSGTRVF